MKRRNYHVKQVESTPNTEVLLRYMQREILPADRVICPSQGWWWVAYRGEEACGFGCLMQSSQWEDTVYLARSGVMLSHQGFGIQKRLISRRTAFARSIGMRWAVSDTTDNPASANSLIACGFKLFEPSKPWGSERTIYWRRDLAL